MKKFLSALVFLIPALLKAQITITGSHLPFTGQTYINAEDDTYNAAIPAGGAAQTWNYTGLLSLDYDTVSFLNATNTPYGPSHYPSSNMAIHTPEDSMYIYISTNSGGLYLDGYYFYTSQPPFGQNAIPFTPSYLFIPTPFTYQDTRNSFYKYVIDIDTALPHIRFVHHVNLEYNGDGYGTLQLPGATYNNTLRIKHTETTIDSLLADTIGNGSYFLVDPPTLEQNSSYQWLQAAQPALLLTINSDSIGTTGQFSSYLSSSLTSVDDHTVTSAPGVSVFPNPASDFVRVDLPEPGGSDSFFRLCDMQGRLVRETALEGISGYGFWVNTLPAGVYMWNISGTVQCGRLVITK